METVGVLKVKGETKQVSDKFKSRDMVLTTEAASPYPQYVTFQLSQDKCSLLDGLNVGDEIKVLFNLKGRSWTSPQGEEKFFNTLDAWKIEKVGAGASKTPAANPAKTNVQGQAPAPAAAAAASSAPTFTASSVDDDLPF